MGEVWQVRRDTFVGAYPVSDADLEGIERAARQEVDEHAADWMPRTLSRVPSSPGFFFAAVRGQPEDVALIQQDEFDGTYDVVGGYVGSTLWVERGLRGRGLAAELVLAKAARCDTLDPVSYTTAGKAAHESAHRLAVQRALRAGHRVPREVMEDYPELCGPVGGARRCQVAADAATAPGPC